MMAVASAYPVSRLTDTAARVHPVAEHDGVEEGLGAERRMWRTAASVAATQVTSAARPTGGPSECSPSMVRHSSPMRARRSRGPRPMTSSDAPGGDPLPAAGCGPAPGHGNQRRRCTQIEDPAPGGHQQVERHASRPARHATSAGPRSKCSRTVAPTNGPSAMPRKLDALTAPSARARACPSNSWLAPAVASGRMAPPPRPWTTRAATRVSSDPAAPESSEPSREQPQGD